MNGNDRPGYGSGDAARMVGLPLWKFLYFLDRGIFPEASFRVSGRRFFTEHDLQKIIAILAHRAGQSSRQAVNCGAAARA
jgi:DNA-binding transcriptional MerR regulator